MYEVCKYTYICICLYIYVDVCICVSVSINCSDTLPKCPLIKGHFGSASLQFILTLTQEKPADIREENGDRMLVYKCISIYMHIHLNLYIYMN
jgi:hypothetical protein